MSFFFSLHGYCTSNNILLSNIEPRGRKWYLKSFNVVPFYQFQVSTDLLHSHEALSALSSSSCSSFIPTSLQGYIYMYMYILKYIKVVVCGARAPFHIAPIISLMSSSPTNSQHNVIIFAEDFIMASLELLKTHALTRAYVLSRTAILLYQNL